MYKMVKEPGAWIDVEWDGLDEEGYEVKHSIRADVVFLPLTEMTEHLAGTTGERTVEFAKRVTRDWSQIRGADNKPLPFTAENLELIFEVTPGFAIGFQSSYNKAWMGQGKVREKNSEGSPDDGRAEAAPRAKRRQSKTS